jgi:hypothetical protein
VEAIQKSLHEDIKDAAADIESLRAAIRKTAKTNGSREDLQTLAEALAVKMREQSDLVARRNACSRLVSNALSARRQRHGANSTWWLIAAAEVIGLSDRSVRELAIEKERQTVELEARVDLSDQTAQLLRDSGSAPPDEEEEFNADQLLREVLQSDPDSDRHPDRPDNAVAILMAPDAPRHPPRAEPLSPAPVSLPLLMHPKTGVSVYQ